MASSNLSVQTQFTPSSSSSKINQLTELTQFTGEELVLCQLNGKNYTFPKKLISTAPAQSSVTVWGPTELYVDMTYTFTISNYDFIKTYNISVSSGSVSSIDSQTGNFTLTTPNSAQTITLTVNDKNYELTVLPATTQTPVFILPNNLAQINCTAVLLKASAFANNGPTDTQLSASWQIATDSAFTQIVQQSMNDTVNLNQIVFKNLNLSTTYYARVQYTGQISQTSQWSNTVSFTTSNICYPSAEIYEFTLNNTYSQSYSYFGQSIATTADGSILAVSAPALSQPGQNTGAIFIYDTSTTPYTLNQTLFCPNNTSGVDTSNFGITMSMTGDGTFLAVGFPSGTSVSNTSLNYAGLVYLYKQINGTYSLVQTIEPPTPQANIYFGQRVVFSPDGSALVITCNTNNFTASDNCIFIYNLSPSATQATYVTGLSKPFNIGTVTTSYSYVDSSFGTTLAVSNNASVIVTCSNSADAGYGALVIYIQSGSTYNNSILLARTDLLLNPYSNLGSCVSVSADGSTIAVGASTSSDTVGNTSYNSNGRVLVVSKNSQGQYILNQTLYSPTISDYENFGYSVLLSTDMQFLIVVGNLIYIYEITNNQYSLVSTLDSTVSNNGNWKNNQYYTFSSIANQYLALNNNYTQLWVGNTNTNTASYYQEGAVYVFSCYQNPTLVSITDNNSGGSGSSSSLY